MVKVAISAGDGGSVSPEGTIEIKKGDDLKIFASPDDHYQVDNWFIDGQGCGIDANVYYLNGVSRDTSVSVKFAEIRHSIVTTPQEGAEALEGSVKPWSSTNSGPWIVADGASQLFIAYPAKGHVVQRWIVDNIEMQKLGDRFTLDNIRSDHFLRVEFSPILTVGPFAEVPTVGSHVSLNADEDLQKLAKETNRTLPYPRGNRIYAAADLTDLPKDGHAGGGFGCGGQHRQSRHPCRGLPAAASAAPGHRRHRSDQDGRRDRRRYEVLG
jgi:hypothetical protein